MSRPLELTLQTSKTPASNTTNSSQAPEPKSKMPEQQAQRTVIRSKLLGPLLSTVV